MLTLTRQGLLLSLSATVIPSQGSSDVPVAVVNDINTYVGYTLEPRVGYYLNGIYKSIVCPYDTSAKNFSVPAEAFKQIGIIDITLALIDNANANHIETCQTVHATVNKAPLGTVVLPDQTTWQDYVNSYMNQLFDSNYKPQFDQIQQDLENLVTEAQQQQQTAEQQQTQIDNAISVMGEYQIVSNDPVQIQFKQGDGTFGPTVDLGDGLASKSMVNAGYYQSIGSQYSGSASDYGIEVEKIVGAYSQGLNPSPDNPQEMQAVEIGNLYSVGKNLLNNKNFKNKSNGDTTGVATETGVTIKGNYFVYYVIDNVPKNTDLYLSYAKSGAGRNMVSVYDNESFDNLITSKTDGSSLSFNVGENESIVIVFYCSSGTANTSTYSNIMLNVGSTADPYTPYTGADTVTLSEPLTLRALPNGVADTYEDGVITRRVGVVEFDGSSDEIWKYNNNNTYPYFVIQLSNGLSSGKPETILSNKLRCVNNISQAENWTGYEIENKIVIFNNELNSVEQFKTWLQSNPITVWYELATPTTEAFEIPRLQSFYPFTNAWCDSIVQPQITWNVLTGKSSILDGNGNLIQQGYMTPQDNLLINSDFRHGAINQKGQSSYNTQYQYGIDMWYQISTGTLTVNDDSISTSADLKQFFDRQPEDGDYTVAISVDATLYTYTFEGFTGTSKTHNFSIGSKTLGVEMLTKQIILYMNGNTFNIDFVKLEKGNHFTGMPVWNEGLELLKCMRYYQPFYVLAHRNSESGNNLYYSIDTMFPVPMAKSPTVNVTKVYTPNGDDITSSTTVDDIGVSYRNVGTVHFGEDHGYIMLKIDLILDAYDY